jgi:hypothetical protein
MQETTSRLDKSGKNCDKTGEKPTTGSTYNNCGGVLSPPHLSPEAKGGLGTANDIF